MTRCSEPYPDLEPIQVATRVAYENLKPSIPAGSTSTIARIMNLCSASSPELRPEFSDIINLLESETSVFDE